MEKVIDWDYMTDLEMGLDLEMGMLPRCLVMHWVTQMD